MDKRLITFTAALSLTEVGLGSLLHGFKIPLSGQLLSLNQIFILSILAIDLKNEEKLASFEVSTCTAILKSLSPAGKKLTPMLAISAQGFLHNVGTLLLGRGIIGITVANILSSLWAFIQPFMIYVLLFGKDLIHMANYFLNKLSPIISISLNEIFWVLGFMILFKCLLAIIISFISFSVDEKFVHKYLEKIAKYSSIYNEKNISVSRGIIRDLTRPIFLASLILMGSFYFITSRDQVTFFWNLIRPLGIAIIIFWIIRVAPMDKLIVKIQGLGLKKIGALLDSSLKLINEKSHPEESKSQQELK